VVKSMPGLHQTTRALPLLAGGRPSDSPEDWANLAPFDPVLRAWVDMATAGGALKYFKHHGSERIHSDFAVLPRGRFRHPDLEGLRRLAGAGLFEPTQGCGFLIVELPDLELRSLAAVCEHRHLGSTLANTFRAKTEPLALLVQRLTQLGIRSPEEVARAVVDAAPMGGSLESIKAFAHDCFDFDLGVAEIDKAHEELQTVFSELRMYLEDDTKEVMAGNLKTTPTNIDEHLGVNNRFGYFPDPPPWDQVREWFLGYEKLDDRTVEKLWALLTRCNMNPSHARQLQRRCLDEELYARLFGKDVHTMTGRIRGGMLFADARRAEYLDVADDAAKAALFSVVAEGFKIVAFTSGTLVVELPIEEGGEEKIAQVQMLVDQAAGAVLGNVPVVCETRPAMSW
jgi:hypothetical protein